MHALKGKTPDEIEELSDALDTDHGPNILLPHLSELQYPLTCPCACAVDAVLMALAAKPPPPPLPTDLSLDLPRYDEERQDTTSRRLFLRRRDVILRWREEFRAERLGSMDLRSLCLLSPFPITRRVRLCNVVDGPNPQLTSRMNGKIGVAFAFTPLPLNFSMFATQLCREALIFSTQ